MECVAEQSSAVPASLALAQSANESAWGTSRFAREFGVRMLNAEDGMGHMWGFIKRIAS